MPIFMTYEIGSRHATKGPLVQQRKNIAQGQKGQNSGPSGSAIKTKNMNKGGSAKGKNC